jgi:hypothetical protein
MDKTVIIPSGVSIAAYELMERERNKVGISDFVFKRLSERYLIPLERVPLRFKNGFSIMANACLLIETYESFRQGWDNTSSNDRRPFESFFNREDRFKDFKYEYSRDFYLNVRCAILHQGETKNGWLITRETGAPIFNKTEKTINATKFFKALRKSLEAYRDLLITADWDDDDVWVNCRKKISFIIENCE